MTITELRYIVALDKERHFGKAADSVFVSQPTLSIGIKKLEEELDTILFERLSHKVIPTQTGIKVIQVAKQMLDSVNHIKEISQQENQKQFGTVKLGVIFTLSPYLMPSIMTFLNQKNPDIKLFIQEDYTESLITQLKDGHIDLAILSSPIKDSQKQLITKELFEEPFNVILPKSHKLSHKMVIHSDDISSELLFLLGNEHCFRNQAANAYNIDLSDPSTEDFIIQGASLETIRLMVASGLGISIFPDMASHSPHHNHQTVEIKSFPEPIPKRKVILVWRKSYLKKAVIDSIVAAVLSVIPDSYTN